MKDQGINRAHGRVRPSYTNIHVAAVHTNSVRKWHLRTIFAHTSCYQQIPLSLTNIYTYLLFKHRFPWSEVRQ